MGASQMAQDAMAYVREVGPVLLVVASVSFADLAVVFLVKLIGQLKAGKLKW